MKNTFFAIALIFSAFTYGQKLADAFAMIPEGTVLTLNQDYVIPADSALVMLNGTGGEHQGGSFSQIHLTFKKSNEWRTLKKGTQFTVKGFAYLHNIDAFKVLLDHDDVFLFISGIVRPMNLQINIIDDYFDIKFPPRKIYGTDQYEAPRDTIIISPLLPGQVDSIKTLYQDTIKTKK